MNRKSIVRVPCSKGFDGYLPGMFDAGPRVACQAEPYRTKVLLSIHACAWAKCTLDPHYFAQGLRANR